MKPQDSRKEFVSEKVPTDEFLTGTIQKVEYEKEHQFKGKFARVSEAVRIVIKLDGYEQLKKTRWMTFNYDEKSALFKLVVQPLVKDAYPYLDFDIQKLEGMKVKVMFSEDTFEGKTFYGVQMLKPAKGKLDIDLPTVQIEEEPSGEDTPF